MKTHTIILIGITLFSFQAYSQDTKEQLLGKAFSYHSNNLDSAIFYFTEYIKLDSTNKIAFEERARNLAWFEPEKALEDYKKALSIDSTSTNALSGIGYMYKKLGQTENALKIFHQLNEVGDEQILVEISNTYLEQNKEKELRDCVEKMIHSEDVSLAKYGRLQMGDFYVNNEQYNEALVEYIEATNYEGEFTNEYFKIACVYFKLGKIEEGCNSLKKFKQTVDFIYFPEEEFNAVYLENCVD